MKQGLRGRVSRGFTLVEVLVVVLIIGILAAVAIPKYMNTKNRAYNSIVAQDGNNLNVEIKAATTGLSDFGSTNGTIVYDTVGQQLTITLGTGATVIDPFLEKLTKGATASGVTYANTTQWCLHVVYNDSHAIYTDQGFTNTQTSCGATPGANDTGGLPVVSGGTLASDATYYYRTFLSSGTLIITGAPLTADVLIIGGGGSGAKGTPGVTYGGGGGSGGIQNPLAQALSANSYSIVVGTGGVGSATANTTSNGSESSGFGFTAGGGLGGNSNAVGTGGSTGSPQSYTAATGTVNPSSGGGGQGNAAGTTLYNGRLGTNAYAAWTTATETGVSGYFAGGGGGAADYLTGIGDSGGGNGAQAWGTPTSGTANTGSGGGGMRGDDAPASGSGGSGIVIIRYTKASVGG